MPSGFEWDSDKAESNSRKHRISFETASRVFADPLALIEQDRVEDGEQRWHVIGQVDGALMLMVAHVVRERMMKRSSVSFRLDLPHGRRGDAIKKQMVRFQIDLANLPPLTKAQKAEVEAAKSIPDSEIDFSDIPLLTESFWQNAIRNPYYKPTKTSTTVRIDSDVLAWLRTQGKGYQSRINAILRREMLAAVKAPTAK